MLLGFWGPGLPFRWLFFCQRSLVLRRPKVLANSGRRHKACHGATSSSRLALLHFCTPAKGSLRARQSVFRAK